MPIEREIKFPVDDFDVIRENLNRMDGRFVDRYFEENIVFDYPDKKLKKRGVLLRLRTVNKKSVLCVKEPILEGYKEDVKVFEEVETFVENRENIVVMFKKIGLDKSLEYEKIREKWTYNDVIICLDRLPFGDYVEIEGKGDLMEVAKKLGLPLEDVLCCTYHELNANIRKRMGLPPCDSFVFRDWTKYNKRSFGI